MFASTVGHLPENPRITADDAEALTMTARWLYDYGKVGTAYTDEHFLLRGSN